jgi:dienelactone hydrolase
VIQTSDGMELSGTFYPAARAGAPLVVLMHWAPGDQTDWRVIAAWLQNRGLAVEPGSEPWLDASWFPAMPESSSFNVFTFTFRGCEGGCAAFDREGWALDVEAAMTHAATLPEIDPAQVMAIGASIGADGAAYGCHYYNEMVQEGCQIAISLSPGGYLKMPYPEEVSALESEIPAKPTRCLYAVGDAEAAGACQNASGQSYLGFEYEGSDHGMALIEPTRAPNPLDIILESITKLVTPSP